MLKFLNIIKLLFCLYIAFLIAACVDSDNSDNTITTTTGYSVSGSIQINANIQVDADTNDPFTSEADNDSGFAAAQPVNNIVSIHGFVSKNATGYEGDRFQSTADAVDLYAVSLQANQVIRLHVVNYDGIANEERYEGDIDIFLLDANAPNAEVAASIGVNEYEQIQVTTAGDYILRVESISGSSRYVLDFLDFFDTVNYAHGQNIRFSEVMPNQAVVKYRSAPVTAQQQTTKNPRAMLLDLNLPANQVFKSATLSSLDQEWQSLYPDSYDIYQTLTAIKALDQQDNIDYAAPNFIRQSMLLPNDEYYSLQWHYPYMNLPQAWDISTGVSTSRDVIVAVVDTGVYLAHQDLAANLVDGYDFISETSISNDGDGIDANPDDPGDGVAGGQNSWHGTHVSGTVAANTNNTTGVAGTSWSAKIMPMRALGVGGGTSYDVIQAVRYAAGLDNDSGSVPTVAADIINLSLGGGGSSAAEQTLYDELYDSGIIVVAAAGNENTSAPSYPASYSGVFSVSAVNINSELASYSNFGSFVDIAAPGGDVTDLNNDGYVDGVLSTSVAESGSSKSSSYIFQIGTSMATPHVAGMFALMKAVHPSLTAKNIDALLQAGDLTEDAGVTGRDDLYGYGIADAYKAVVEATKLANGGTLPALPPSMRLSPNAFELGAGSNATITLSNQGDGTPQVQSIVSTDPWLTVTPTNVDGNGLGDYEITINRSGLSDGIYLATITFNFVDQTGTENDASAVTANLSMFVGDIDTSGATSQLFALLIDADSFTLVEELRVDSSSLAYNFENIATGNYFLIAGTDVDNDLYVCSTGEVCGGYPNINQIQPIEVNDNKTDVDFSVNMISNLSLSSHVVSGLSRGESNSAGSNVSRAAVQP